MTAFHKGIQFLADNSTARVAPVIDFSGDVGLWDKLYKEETTELIAPYKDFWVIESFPDGVGMGKAMFIDGVVLSNNTMAMHYSLFEDPLEYCIQGSAFLEFNSIQHVDEWTKQTIGRATVAAYNLDGSLLEDARQPDLETREEIQKGVMEFLVRELSVISAAFKSKECRIVERTPKRVRLHDVKPASTHDRPILRLVKLDELVSQYKRDTGVSTGIVMPPHPRRAHWRVLRSPRYKENVGKKIFIESCNVNGWVWETSKGVKYKLI